MIARRFAFSPFTLPPSLRAPRSPRMHFARANNSPLYTKPLENITVPLYLKRHLTRPSGSNTYHQPGFCMKGSESLVMHQSIPAMPPLPSSGLPPSTRMFWKHTGKCLRAGTNKPACSNVPRCSRVKHNKLIYCFLGVLSYQWKLIQTKEIFFLSLAPVTVLRIYLLILSS